jgi:6-pyruvoyltetrahydropterin/6-carboxytetrahydropterin synthase
MMPRMTVVRRFEFCASHFLPGHPGPCDQLHGHNYVLEVGVSGAVKESGFIIDFGELKRIVIDEVVCKIDHTHLNKNRALHSIFRTVPTAENICLWITSKLTPALMGRGVRLHFVKLWETSNCYVEWRNPKCES